MPKGLSSLLKEETTLVLVIVNSSRERVCMLLSNYYLLSDCTLYCSHYVGMLEIPSLISLGMLLQQIGKRRIQEDTVVKERLLPCLFL